MLSRGSWSEAQQRGSMAEAAQGDSSPFLWRAAWWSPGAFRRFSAVRGPADKRWRAGGEAFFVEGCIVTTHYLALPRRELRGSPHICLFNCFPLFSNTAGLMHVLCYQRHKLMLSSTASINFIF